MADSSSTLPPPPTTLRERIGQLIMVRIGSNLPPIQTAGDDEDRVAAILDELPVGGLLLFNGGDTAKEVLERLQSRARVPLLIGSDIERGVGQQVKGFALFPHAMAFERLGDGSASALADYANLLARDAHGVGIHIAFAPVADVNTNPRNPIIATRAYGEEPHRTAELVTTYVRAAETAGLRTTAKHFPGHGDTHQDSHDSLPSVPRTLEELAARDLVPFQAAIDAGCSLIMTAHVAFPQIDSSGLPATLSSTLLKGLLRERLGFQGVVCSDSLLMAGVRQRFASEGEMALAALAAGVDLLLDIKDPADVISFMTAAVESGTLDAARIDEAFERVWALKQKSFEAPTTAGVSNRRGRPSGDPDELAASVARRAIQFIGDRRISALPYDAGTPITALLLKPFASPLDPPEQALAGALRERFRDVVYVELGPDTSADEFAVAERVAGGADQLLVAMVVKPAAWHAFGLLAPQEEFVQRLTQDHDLVLASLGVPYAFGAYPEAKTCVCTYSDVPVSQQALVEFLLAPTI